MKKLIFLILLASMLCASCELKDRYMNRYMIYSKKDIYTYSFDIVIIDSCEYLLNRDMLAHKGNCRFCKERNERYWKRRDSIR